jgi:hypothetical protein
MLLSIGRGSKGENMSDTNKPQSVEQPKKRKARSPSVAKPAFIVVQVLDEHGRPTAFDKKRLKVLAVERSAEKVMEEMESGAHENAFYLRVLIPAGQRPAQPRTGPTPVSAAA